MHNISNTTPILIRKNTKSRQSANKFRKSQIHKTHARKLTTNSTECSVQNTENTETHVHKITNVPVFYMALGFNDFDAGKSITRVIGRGGPSKWILCPVALHTALNRSMPIFQRALICGRFNLAGYYFT